MPHGEDRQTLAPAIPGHAMDDCFVRPFPNQPLDQFSAISALDLVGLVVLGRVHPLGIFLVQRGA